MILSVGEILTDMIGEDDVYKMYIGGAPFNASVSAVKSGGKCLFVGKVGNDVAGNFIKREIKNFGLIANIITDENHNTTMAFVSLKNGERSFSFLRKNTADYNLEIEEIPFPESVKIVNMGTLMLSESKGRKFADSLLEKTKKENRLLAMDANFRDDLFGSDEERNKVILPYLIQTDILKFSKDELINLTKQNDIFNAVKVLDYRGILFVTDGENGSYAFYKGKTFYEPSKKATPVDSTGAGDAFFGTVLAEIEKVFEKNGNLTNCLSEILIKANESGLQSIMHFGAVQPI